MMEHARVVSARREVQFSRSSVVFSLPVKVLELFLPTARCSPSTVQFCCTCSQPTVNIAQVSGRREVRFQGNPRCCSAAFFRRYRSGGDFLVPQESADVPVHPFSRGRGGGEVRPTRMRAMERRASAR